MSENVEWSHAALLEKSLVRGEALWFLPAEEVEEVASDLLPMFRDTVFDWARRRPTLFRNSSIGRQFELLIEIASDVEVVQREQEYLILALMEAKEFERAVLYQDVSKEERQLELGDVLFYLSLHYSSRYLGNRMLSNYAGIIGLGFKPESHRLELRDEIGERVIVSAVELAAEAGGVGSPRRGIINDSSTETAIAMAYNVIFRYAMGVGWDLKELMEKTKVKNESNFWPIMFSTANPFREPSDAMTFLQLLRRISGDDMAKFRKSLDEHLGVEMGFSAGSDPARMADYHTKDHNFRRYFRDWCYGTLDSVKMNPTLALEFRKEAELLLAIGQWDDMPLSLA